MMRFIVLCFIAHLVLGGSPQEWKSRTIYQLLTDRFGRSDGNTNNCGDLGNYCGGTFQGIINHLDYIQGMGFDAIWISPVIQNTQGGYHGYWAQNIYNINSYFGSADDLQRMINACHQRGIWVMLDVVANHMGPVGYDYSSLYPFNGQQYFHDCNPCPSGCNINDFGNQPQVEWCRLAGLPDLAQESNVVSNLLTQWIANLTKNFSFDGIRIDTTPEVPKSFWSKFVSAAGTYAVGEVFNGDVGYVSGYQAPSGPLPGVLSYPLFFTLRDVFANGRSMNELESINQAYQSKMGDVNLLGTFLDNHDNQRFRYIQSNDQMYKNAIAYVLLSTGIPIIYYGTEQGFDGGNDPYCREVLWPTRYDTSSDFYQFIKKVVTYRKTAQVWNYPQVQRYSNDDFYAFTRGNTFVALTNKQNGVQITITYQPYPNGTKICNLFNPTSDCLLVSGGQFTVSLQNGECKIYYPV